MDQVVDLALEHQINEKITCTAILSLKSLQYQQSEKLNIPGQNQKIIFFLRTPGPNRKTQYGGT